MPTKKKQQLAQIRWVSISMAIGITTLACEYLWTRFSLFLYSALALSLLGLTLISLTVNRIIKARPHFSRHKPR